MNSIAWILLVFFIQQHLSSLHLLGFPNAFFPQVHSYLLCFSLSATPNTTLSFLLPRFRIQYSLSVADRLADEHVLIGLYVNMLRNNPSWLVQVWLPDCPWRGEQSHFFTSSLSKGQSLWMPRVSLRHFLTDSIKISFVTLSIIWIFPINVPYNLYPHLYLSCRDNLCNWAPC